MRNPVHIIVGFFVAILVIVLGNTLIEALHPNTSIDLETIFDVLVILAWLWWSFAGAGFTGRYGGGPAWRGPRR